MLSQPLSKLAYFVLFNDANINLMLDNYLRLNLRVSGSFWKNAFLDFCGIAVWAFLLRWCLAFQKERRVTVAVWLKGFNIHSHRYSARYLPPRNFSDTLFFINIKIVLYAAYCLEIISKWMNEQTDINIIYNYLLQYHSKRIGYFKIWNLLWGWCSLSNSRICRWGIHIFKPRRHLKSHPASGQLVGKGSCLGDC